MDHALQGHEIKGRVLAKAARTYAINQNATIRLDASYAGVTVLLRLFQLLEPEPPECWYAFGFPKALVVPLLSSKKIQRAISRVNLDELVREDFPSHLTPSKRSVRVAGTSKWTLRPF